MVLRPGGAEDMVVLRAGLCPGLTEEMIQLLRANGIRTGNEAAAGSPFGECHPLHVWGGTVLSSCAEPICQAGWSGLWGSPWKISPTSVALACSPEAAVGSFLRAL